MPAPPLREQSAAPPRLALALPSILATLSYAVGLRNGFTEDDTLAILRHPVVNGVAPAWQAFTRTFWGAPLGVDPPSYRPLATLSFRLDAALFGGVSSAGMHATSLLYYVACVALGQRLLGAWLDARAALWAACLFATVPVHAENVASLVGRADVLALGFQLGALAILGAGRTEARPGASRVALAAAAYLAALLCKESAAALPAIVAALAWFTTPEGIPRRDALRRLWPAGALAAVGVLYVVARARFVPGTFGYLAPDDVVAGGGAFTHVQFALELVARYARLLVAPADLCTGRKYAVLFRADGPSALGLAGALALALCAWATVRDYRARRAPFWLCAIASWWVFSSLPLALPEAMADRFLLAPSFFLAAGIARVAAPWAARSRPRFALLALWIAIQSLASVFYATRWESDATLFRHAVTACPDSVHDHLRYADVLSAQGDHEEAAWHYAVAAEGRGHFPREWHHPAADEELSMPAVERLRAMHGLLRVRVPEASWRHALAGFLRARGRNEEAALVEAP